MSIFQTMTKPRLLINFFLLVCDLTTMGTGQPLWCGCLWSCDIQFPLHFSFIQNYWIVLGTMIGKYTVLSVGVCLGLWCLSKHRHPLMSQVIGQVCREVAGHRKWPFMRMPQFIGFRRNGLPDSLVTHSEQWELPTRNTELSPNQLRKGR